MTQDYAGMIKWDILEYVNGQGLDLGCGDFRPHDWMVGVDLKPGTGPKGPNLIGDARKLLFADESQDFVFSAFLLNELEDHAAVLREWWRVVKPFGYLILFLPITDKCTPRGIAEAMATLRPWQACDIRSNGQQFFQVYRKCDLPTALDKPPPEKVCALMKLGAHGDALWASSVLPHLKEQGYHIVFYTQDTGYEVLKNDPHIDHMIKFESRVPIEQLGELFAWMEQKYKRCHVLVECVEGVLLPAPNKIQYHFPHEMRHKLMDHNYIEMHHLRCQVPMDVRMKFYPTEDEKKQANEFREKLNPIVIVVVPNGSSVSKMWPYTPELVRRLVKNPDVSVVMIGDERGMKFDEHPNLHKIGLSWHVRQAMTFCQLADVVVGQETGMLNAVAMEAHVKKVVLLTHSTPHNLTRDWPNTVALSGNAPCYPCHRLHYDWSHCSKNELTGAAQCQSRIRVDSVMDALMSVLEAKLQQAA